MHEVHKEVKNAYEMAKKEKNGAGELCCRKDEIENTWISYIEKLYGDADRDTQMERLEYKSKSPLYILR